MLPTQPRDALPKFTPQNQLYSPNCPHHRRSKTLDLLQLEASMSGEIQLNLLRHPPCFHFQPTHFHFLAEINQKKKKISVYKKNPTNSIQFILELKDISTHQLIYLLFFNRFHQSNLLIIQAKPIFFLSLGRKRGRKSNNGK